MTTHNILMVDDHQLILEGYKNILLAIESIDFFIDTANTCDAAWEKIKKNSYDIVFLDISFSNNEHSIIKSGEDLGELIKQHHPKIKLIILTAIEESLRLQNILDHCNPSGLLLKSETDSEILQLCIRTIIAGSPYYSPTITRLVSMRIKQSFSLDKTDRLILHYLAMGTKTKNIPDYVNLSLRAVEDRKRKLKRLFNVSGNDNKSLIEKAKANGYI